MFSNITITRFPGTNQAKTKAKLVRKDLASKNNTSFLSSSCSQSTPSGSHKQKQTRSLFSNFTSSLQCTLHPLSLSLWHKLAKVHFQRFSRMHNSKVALLTKCCDIIDAPLIRNSIKEDEVCVGSSSPPASQCFLRFCGQLFFPEDFLTHVENSYNPSSRMRFWYKKGEKNLENAPRQANRSTQKKE